MLINVVAKKKKNLKLSSFSITPVTFGFLSEWKHCYSSHLKLNGVVTHKSDWPTLNKCFCSVKETSIRAGDITQLKTREKFQWDEVKGAKNYICRICGPDINCSSLLGYEPSLEIPYSTLNFKSEKNKPDPVEVAIVVLAVGENDVIGKGGPFNISKFFCCIGQQLFHCIRQQTWDKCANFLIGPHNLLIIAVMKYYCSRFPSFGFWTFKVMPMNCTFDIFSECFGLYGNINNNHYTNDISLWATLSWLLQ